MNEVNYAYNDKIQLENGTIRTYIDTAVLPLLSGGSTATLWFSTDTNEQIVLRVEDENGVWERYYANNIGFEFGNDVETYFGRGYWEWLLPQYSYYTKDGTILKDEFRVCEDCAMMLVRNYEGDYCQECLAELADK